jgi:hypothetical protein
MTRSPGTTVILTWTIFGKGVYNQLKARKRPDENFSNLLDRIANRNTGFEQGFGALAGVEFELVLAELDVVVREDIGGDFLVGCRALDQRVAVGVISQQTSTSRRLMPRSKLSRITTR